MIRTYASAGAVVSTNDLQQPKILLLDQIRKTGERQTVAPKGRLEPGEAPLLAAAREVAEETGLRASRYGAYLGQESYRFIDNDAVPAAKTVDWFLFTTADATASPQLDEGFVGCRWLDPATARQSATHVQFHTVLNRAFEVITWRSDAPLAFSPVLAVLVQEVATEASALLAEQPNAGVGLCGSAARGDFVDGWSDVDFIAWNLPNGSGTAQELTALVAQAAQRNGLHASLHLADETGGDARRLGPLYDMKMRAVMRRVGIDVPVIAGTGPTAMADAPAATDLDAQIRLLHDFATTRLQASAGTDKVRKDTARRVLSVLSSAARLAVCTREPDTSLRLPTVADALQQHWPDCNATALLRDYDAFRRAGARDLDTAERLARQAPTAIRCIDKCTHQRLT